MDRYLVESPHEAGDCDAIIKDRDSQRRLIGAVGVIGPSRINYARIIPMVDYTAKVIGRILG